MGNVADIHKLPGSWGLEEGETQPEYPRYIGKRNEPKEHVNFKSAESLIRFVDEYVAKQADPFVRTRSDAFNDALLAWVLAHREATPKLSILAMQIEATYRGYELESYDTTIRELERLIDKCVKTRNK